MGVLLFVISERVGRVGIAVLAERGIAGDLKGPLTAFPIVTVLDAIALTTIRMPPALWPGPTHLVIYGNGDKWHPVPIRRAPHTRSAMTDNRWHRLRPRHGAH
jgi:hypothetical protein